MVLLDFLLCEWVPSSERRLPAFSFLLEIPSLAPLSDGLWCGSGRGNKPLSLQVAFGQSVLSRKSWSECWLVRVYAGCFQDSNLLEESKTGIFYFKFGFDSQVMLTAWSSLALWKLIMCAHALCAVHCAVWEEGSEKRANTTPPSHSPLHLACILIVI